MDTKTIIEQFEQEYPTLAKSYKEILKQQYELFASKMLSYGIDNISLGTRLETPDEKKLSLTGVYIRCMDKINRLKNLIVFNKTNPLNDESIEDTYKDLVNYNIIAQLVYKNLWKK
jgi:hypothetical protein